VTTSAVLVEVRRLGLLSSGITNLALLALCVIVAVRRLPLGAFDQPVPPVRSPAVVGQQYAELPDGKPKRPAMTVT